MEQVINSQVELLKNLYTEQTRLKNQINQIEETLKEYMTNNNKTLFVTNAGTISYKEIVSRTLNTTELKKSEFAFIYDKFLQEKSTMRFKVA